MIKTPQYIAYSIPNHCEAALEQRNDMLRRASWRQRIAVVQCSTDTSDTLWIHYVHYDRRSASSKHKPSQAADICRSENWTAVTSAAPAYNRTQAQARTHSDAHAKNLRLQEEYDSEDVQQEVLALRQLYPYQQKLRLNKLRKGSTLQFHCRKA